MKKKQIILPKLRYENAPELDSQIQIGFDEKKSLLKIDDRDIILDLAEQFATERAASNRYIIYGKMKMVFRNLYAGASPYLYLRERLALVGDGSDGNFCGFLPYNEFAFLRDDLYYETTEPVSVDVLSGFTQFTLITSGSTEHTTITNLTAPYHNWNIYLSYIYDHEINFPMKYTLSGETAPVLSFVSGDGIPFRVEETSNEYILTSPVKHGISQGEYIVINNNYYYVNSVGNSTYRSEDYVLNILKSQFLNTTLDPVITGKRCTDISDKDNCTSEYYVHKHKTLTKATEGYIDKVGFESPIWEDEQKLLYENSVGDNNVLVVRNRMESILFYFKEPFILSGITNNLGYTPTEVYTSVIFRNGDGYFYYPPKVGYSFHMHDTWIDEHFDGDTASETGVTYTDFYRQGLAFHGGNEIPVGTELFGAFVEYNPKEMKERIISEAFHKIVADPLIFNHAQTASSTYSGATPTNPIGLLYQPHYRFKLRELSPYVESSDISTPMYNLPENAVYFPNEKVWRWRDLYEDGYIDPDGYGTDYPYLNDMHYIHKDVNFYIRNEQVYTNKKDGLIDFYKNQKTDECGTNSIAYLRGYVIPSLSATPGLTPSISVSPTVTRTPTRTPTPTGTPGASMTPSISMSMIAPSPSLPIIVDALYVSPTGSDTMGTGSVDSPFFTLNKVWEFVTAGSTVYMRGGTYYYTSRQYLTGKNGTAGNTINIYAYPGETPVITRAVSFTYPSSWPYAWVLITGDYLHIKGLDVSYYTQLDSSIWEGMRAYYCDHSTFEQLDIHHNGGGFQLTNCDDCLVLNSDFHHNQDPLTVSAGAYGNADGLGVDSFDPAYANSHNTIRGCRFWWNTDDGIDGWDQEGYLTIENCWSFWNGFIPDTFTVAGDGNGFKLGRTETSDPTTVRRFLYNNLSFQNKKWGFLDNGLRCNASVINNVAYDNGYTGADPWSGGFNFTTTPENIAYYIKNNISYDNYNSDAEFSNLTNIDHNTWDSAVSVSDADFVSISTVGVTGSRGADGSLPIIDFLKLRYDSDLIWAGTTAAAVNDAAGNPWHEPASMGAYEYIPIALSQSPTPTRTVTRTVTPSISLSRTPSYTPSNAPLGSYFISPSGSDTLGNGTIGNPWYSITKAMTAAVAGNLIYMRGGQYNYTSNQVIGNKNGTPGNLIKIWAYPGETPIVNRSGSGWAYNTGIYVHDSTYIHLKDIEVTGYAQPAPDDWGNGILAMDVSYCIFENIKSHDNCFGMSLGDDDGISTGNLILNSDFYCNEDPITAFPPPYDDLFPYGNADGLTIRCGNSTATVNTVRGCRFYWNSDDGIDLWENEGLIVLEGCQSFYNGFYKNTFTPCGGDGNGFKLGLTLISNTGTVLRKVNGCLAYRNTAWGFHRNGALCNMEIYNNTAYNNTIGGFYFSDYTYGNIPFFIKNNLAYSNGSNNYSLGSTSLTNISNNSWNLAVSITDTDFLTVMPTGINGSRNGDGTLTRINFLQLASASDLIYVGTNVGLSLDGYRMAWHTPPSIGAFEYDASITRTFYVASGGNDANDGSITSPWKTITKVNSVFSSLLPGDRILFRGNETFDGTIIIGRSGTASSPITIGTYGGGDPIINGFITITDGWTNEGNGIYSKVITSDAQTNMVLVNDVQVPMGRWPKGTTYNTFESHTIDSITDTSLSASPNWTGAEVVIRRAWWVLNRHTITNHSGNVITYTGSLYDYGYDGYGYFIQNSLTTLSSSLSPVVNEWYHDYAGTGKFYIYGDPTGKTIKIATKNNLIQNHSLYDYITVDGLAFRGSIDDAISSYTTYATTSDGWTIQNCNIKYAGSKGIDIYGGNLLITNNTTDQTNEAGVYVRGGQNHTITYNNISNVGLLVGQALYGGGSNGITWYGNSTVEHNRITNTGYNGLSFHGTQTTTVRYNIIDGSCKTINDGGCLYYAESTGDTGTVTIEYNIFLNAYGNTNGTPYPTTKLAEGIYLDSWTHGVICRYNVSANNASCGIKNSCSHDNIIEHNLCYNNGETQIFVPGYWSYKSVYNNTIRYNQFIARDTNHLTLKFYPTQYDPLNEIGNYDYNYYARPINQGTNDSHIYYRNAGLGTYNYASLSQWKTYSSVDAHSNASLAGSVASVNDIHFIYNDSDTSESYILSAGMRDVTNTLYSGTIALAPWSGLVLFGVGTVTSENEPTPTPTPTVTRSVTPSVTRSVTPSFSRPMATVAASISNTSGAYNITNVTLASPSPAGLSITGISYPITPGTTRNGTTTYITTNGSVYIYLSATSVGETLTVNGVSFTTNGSGYYNFTNVNTTGGITIGYVGATASAIIANHNIARLSNLLAIPSSAISTAKSTLHIAYEHTSHGEQLVQGMTGLVTWRGSTYAFNSGGSGGALDLRDHAIASSYGCWGADLGNTRCPDNEQYYLWATNTRTYLNANPGINVVIWSWCGQCSYATTAQINQYLALMNQLEIDYPSVKFVYMTGHVDGQAPSGTLFTNNALIRNYCINNNKILFDFADIESYDPSGNFFGDKRVTDCCNYDYNGDGIVSTNGADPGVPVAPDRNWALDWQGSHTLNVDWYNCSASHSYPVNANMKAYAAWWLWAKLGGWSG